MKNIMIIGDSYSTYEGCIPDGYAVYYTKESPEDNTIELSETWWSILAKEKDYKIVLNDSWSGSTIGYTGYDNADCSESSSFIYRLDNYIKNGFFEKNKIDKIIVFGGTNDNWCGAPLGEEMLSGWQKNDLYNVIPSIYYFMHKLKNEVNVKDVVFIINTEFKQEVSSSIIKACELNQFKYVQLSNIDKIHGHPTKNGMKQIAEQVSKEII